MIFAMVRHGVASVLQSLVSLPLAATKNALVSGPAVLVAATPVEADAALLAALESIGLETVAVTAKASVFVAVPVESLLVTAMS